MKPFSLKLKCNKNSIWNYDYIDIIDKSIHFTKLTKDGTKTFYEYKYLIRIIGEDTSMEYVVENDFFEILQSYEFNGFL